MAVNLKSITEVPEITELGDGCKVLVNNNGAAAQIDGSKLGNLDLETITSAAEITELVDGCKVLVNNNGTLAQIDGSKLGGSKRTKELKYEWTPGLAEDGSQIINVSPFIQEITDDVTWMTQPSDEYEVVCEMDFYGLETTEADGTSTTNVTEELRLVGSFNMYSTQDTMTMGGVMFVTPTAFFMTQIATSGEASRVQGLIESAESDTAIKAIRLYKLTY